MAVSLIDIGPLTKEVVLRGNTIAVRGMPALMLFEIMKDNAAVRKLLAERAMDPDLVESLIASAPQFVGECIAACVGKMGDAPTIEFAMTQLVAGETALILQAAIELTFPQGLASFLAGLQALAPDVSNAPSGKAAVTKSQPPSPSASETDI